MDLLPNGLNTALRLCYWHSDMKTLRSYLFLLWLYGVMIAVGIIFLPSLLMPRHVAFFGIRGWVRMTKWGMRVICGATTEIRGLDQMPDGPLLIAPKHQSMYDTLLPFLFVKDPCFVLKKELMYYPIFGLYAAKTGMIALDRSGATKALKQMNIRAKKAVAEGRSIILYPEGTRYAPGAETDYKPGIAFLYKELGIPCVPVALNTGLCWPARGVMRSPGEIVFDILPAIEPGLPRKAFMQTLESQMEAASAVLTEEGRRAQEALV